MRRIWLPLGGVLLVASTALADPHGDFNTLFGAEARKVLATPSKLDDVDFAKQLLEAAKAIPDAPKMQVLLYEKAHEFGMRFKTGYGTAAEALAALANALPKQKDQWRDKQLRVYRLQYAAAPAEEKPAAAKRLVEMLLEDATAKVKAGEIENGLEIYRQALGICTYVRSDRAGEIRSRIEEIMVAVRRQEKIKRLTDALTSDPGNVKARKELILLYLVELDEPEKAMELCGDGALEEEFRTLVPLMVKKVEDVSEADCLKLGQWYAGQLYSEAPEAAQRRLLDRAQQCYVRYLEIHETKDIARYRAQQALKRIREKVRRVQVQSVPTHAREVIVDNADPGVAISGSWKSKAQANNCYKANYLSDGNTAKGAKSVTFSPTLPTKGQYEVSVFFPANPLYSASTPVTVMHRDGSTTKKVSQRAKGGSWVSVGKYNFDAGTAGKVQIGTLGTEGFVIADAVKFVRVGDVGP